MAKYKSRSTLIYDPIDVTGDIQYHAIVGQTTPHTRKKIQANFEGNGRDIYFDLGVVMWAAFKSRHNEIAPD